MTRSPSSRTYKVLLDLRRAIAEGDLGLGEKIGEELLAERYGVSRTPVRDALIQLQVEGLVRVEPKRGSFVFEADQLDVDELVGYRKALEHTALRLGIENNRHELLRRLREASRAMAEALANQNAKEYLRADNQFHEAFFAATSNRYLIASYALISGKVSALRANLSMPDPEERQRSFLEHQHMLKLIEAGDSDSVCELLETHIERTKPVSQVVRLRRGAA